jgi:GntR family transcriptional regulator, transcriptional repressor for pyruvate dehydrogenase complex
MGYLKMFKRKDLITLVKDEMKKYIVDSKFKPGDSIPTEQEFSEIFSVSRTIIREALSGMESLNIIESRQGKGRFIKEVSYDGIVDSFSFMVELKPEEFHNILDIRIALENYYFPRMIDQITEEDIKRLSDIIESMRKIILDDESNEKKLIEAHNNFHKALYQRIGNTFLLKLIDLFSRMQNYFFMHDEFSTENKLEFLTKHEELLEVIVNNRVDVALIILNNHFGEITHNVDKIISKGK